MGAPPSLVCWNCTVPLCARVDHMSFPFGGVDISYDVFRWDCVRCGLEMKLDANEIRSATDDVAA